MSTLRYELINATNNRALALIDTTIHNNIHKQYEFYKQRVLVDTILTNDEKTYAIRELAKNYDRNKIIFNSGIRRICENCNKECLATLYCEYCVRNYLKENFSNWTSGNNDIDYLIQKCQMETLMSNMVVEWIPYSNLKNVKYLTKGGFSEIYTADWIDGRYDEWDSKTNQLERLGTIEVILKELENVENANKSWFEEAKSHLTISNKWADVVRCYGLSQNPSNGNYMLVMMKMDIDLRKYLQQNRNQLTWKDRMKVINEITLALYYIHKENAIHRDLHSGNILYSQLNDAWCISDLGFCGPADNSSKSIYGNLPYIAPEVLFGRGYNFASDIYSIAIIMWEISSGQPPFIIYEDNYTLAMNIINGLRPKFVPGTPLGYENLIKVCWDADPLKRPDIKSLRDKIREIHLSYQNMPNETKTIPNYTSSRLFTSKIHNFGNLPEPRNATEVEQEVFHSKLYDFNIPNNIDDFNKSNEQNSSKSSKIISIFRNSKKLSKLFKKLQINSNDDEKEITLQIKKQNFNTDDDDEIWNNPNFHSNEQDELEIPDDGF